MARDTSHISKIRSENPSLEHSSFVTPQAGRPRTFVMGGTVLAPQGYGVKGNRIVSLQMSPDFAGSPFYPNGGKVSYGSGHSHEFLVGGGFVETFAFGGA